MVMRVSDYIADQLEKLGCRSVFLLSGGGMMHLLDSVSRKEKLKYYCNHHEQASGMAADAYARISGQLGVCYATSGPGGTNTLTAVVGAFQDSSPVLFISGQSKVSQTIRGTGHHGLRQFGTFEVDVISMVQSVTKYAAFVGDKKDIRYHFEKAVYLAMEGRPGPVFLDIPVDIQGALIDPDELRGFDESKELKGLNPEIVENILSQMERAKRPLVLAGQGIRASQQVGPFLEIVEALGVPVVTTPFGKDIIGYDHPLFVGHPGVKGNRPGNFAVQTADFILCLGTSLHVSTTGYEVDQFAPQAQVILVDPDRSVLDRQQVKIAEKVHSPLSPFLQRVKESIKNKSPLDISGWRHKCQVWKDRYLVYNETHEREGVQINFYDFMRSLDEHAGPSDIIVTDAGSAFYIVGQAFRVKTGQRVINSGSLGAMGFALPAATGCAVAASDRRVICVTGDGSLQTNLHELAVYKQNNLNIKLFVINNDGYVCIRNTQTSFFQGHLAGTSRDSGVYIPSLEKLAEAFEIPYHSVKSLENLDRGVETCLSMNGPVICEIFTPPKQEVIPTVSSVKLPDGSMKSKPLHDMYPFMSEEELLENLKLD